MTIQLNHTIVHARDKRGSAEFLANILGIPIGEEFGPFLPIKFANGATLDYMTTRDVAPQHYAFLVDDEVFDAAFARIKSASIEFYAEPLGGRPGEINHLWGGRGVYFHDPDGHAMEILTCEP